MDLPKRPTNKLAAPLRAAGARINLYHMNRHSTPNSRHKQDAARREAASGRRIFISIVAVFVVLALLLIAAMTLL